MSETPAQLAELVDYRHRVESLYRQVRAGKAAEDTWRLWRSGRDQLFGRHPQSPVPGDERLGFEGLAYFPHDPTWRLLAEVEPLEEEPLDVAHSAAGSTEFVPFGRASLERDGIEFSLTLYWLTGYGGGVFLPFRDSTNGGATYGGGRYLLDTVKGADLGQSGRQTVFDFNYAYHPSCTHNPMWSCPLSPPQNRLDLEVTAGEQLRLPSQ